MTRSRALSRRTFLTRAAAAVGAPLVATDLLRAHSSRPPASERITVGVIGTGKRGHTLMRGLARFPEAQVVAVCDVEGTRRDHARQWAHERYSKGDAGKGYAGCTAYTDFRQVVGRKDIDAVIIATPDHWHAIPIVAAARAGKDIYCEKPLTLTIHEAKVVMDVARETGVVFQTGSQQRSECGGRFHRACELVRNGRLGKISDVYAGVGGPSRPCDLPEEECPDNVDWNLWLGPAPRRGYHSALCPKGMHNHYPAWRNYQEYSGGGMTDWGAHHFDIAQWGLGMDESGPVEILPPEGSRRNIIYRYSNGVTLHHGGADGVKFVGEKGWIEVNRGHLRADPGSVLEETIGDGETRLYKATSQLGNWLECIRSRKQPICPAEVGARSVTVCHLGNLAYWHGRRLRWDPAKWEFPGDAEANGWRDRPERAPWKL